MRGGRAIKSRLVKKKIQRRYPCVNPWSFGVVENHIQRVRAGLAGKGLRESGAVRAGGVPV